MKYRFNKYQSIYDSELIFYGLAEDGYEVVLDGVRYIEVTTDFKRVQKVAADGLKVVGHVEKEYA